MVPRLSRFRVRHPPLPHFQTKPFAWTLRTKTRLLINGTIIVAGVGITAYFWPEIYFTGQACRRSFRTISTATRMAYDYKKTLGPFLKVNFEELSAEELSVYEDLKSRLHKSGAERLLALFRKNGGIYIKLGQHLSALEYILPNEYCKAMSVLHNQAPTSSLDDVQKVFMEDLNCKIEDVFEAFDAKPIGAASLAQVHHARLRGSGEKVAVKIQHHSLKAYAEVDMATVAFAVRSIKRFFPEFEFGWLADEMRINLPREMNFVQEAHNAERVARNFISSTYDSNVRVKIPKIFWPFTTKRILTMEYCSGAKINDLEYLKKNEISPYQVSSELTKLYSEMIFLHGFVHCDPHPGNIFVRITGKKETGWRRWFLSAGLQWELVLLDHGLYRELADDFRLAYAQLWKALIEGDEDEIKLNSERLGGGDAYRLFSCILTQRSWDTVALKSIGQPRTIEEIEAVRAKAPLFFVKIAELLARVPRPLLLLLKTNDLLRSVERTLLADSRMPTSTFLIMARYCAQAIYLNDIAIHRYQSWTRYKAYWWLKWNTLKFIVAEWLLRLSFKLHLL